MKTILQFFLCLIILSINVTAQPATQYQKLLGGTGNDVLYGYSNQPTSDGGAISCGYSSTSSNGTLAGLTNNGGLDGWILKSDINGNTTLQKLFGGSADDELDCIRQTSDGGYIAAGDAISSNSGTLTGLTNNGGHDGWIMKLNANGNIVWQKLLGGSSDDYFESVRQTADGGYIISGQSYSSNSGTLTGINGNGGLDAWIIKLNASGNTVWQKLLGGSGFDRFIESVQTADGGYVAVGTATGNSGTLAGLTYYGFLDGWIVKLDAGGNTTWQKLYGSGNSDDQLGSVEQTADGGFIAALGSASGGGGSFGSITGFGGYDGWVLKTDATGNIQWQKLLGGTNEDFLYVCRQTSDGGYILSGQSNSNTTGAGTLNGLVNNGGYDGWVVKLDKQGNTLWQNLYGGSLDDNLFAVQQTGDQGFFVQGYSLSSNSGTLTGQTNHGGNDGWIIKLEAPKVAITSYDTLVSCASTNSISYKILQDSTPYTVQLYRFGVAYGSSKTTNRNVTFSNLPVGSYYAIATSKGVTGKSKTLSIAVEPTNPKTTSIKSTQAKLNWDTVSCADYFSIEYRVHGTTAWSKNKSKGNVNSYILKSLTASTTYDWEVAAVDSANGIIATSTYTDSVVFTTTATGLLADVNNNQDDLSISGNKNITISPNPATSYFIIHYNNNIQEKVTAALYDVNGKVVWTSGLINADALNGKQVMANQFGSGFYYLKITDENGAVLGVAKVSITK